MCVVHRARGAEGFSGTRAQLLLCKQQRCGRHRADLTHQPGADDPGEMTPHGAHVASLSCEPVRLKWGGPFRVLPAPLGVCSRQGLE